MPDADDAQALFERAQHAADEGRHGDAIAVFDEILRRFGDATDEQSNGMVGEAMYRKGQSLHGIEREEDALAVYEEMAARYRDAPEFRGHLSRALYQTATTLARLGLREDALGAWNELLARFADETEPPLAIGVASAYEGKAAALRGLDRLDEAVKTYDELIFRFSDSRFPILRMRVDAALSEKVFVLLLQRRYDEAIIVANAAVERLDDAHDPDALAIAVLNLGGGLASDGRFEEAIGVYDVLIERLGQAEHPVLRGRLILAISNKVEALVVLDRSDEALEVHGAMLDRFGDEVPKAFADAAARNEYDETAKAVVAGMRLKEALALAELGRTRESLIAVNNLIDQFGDEDGDEFARVIAIAREVQAQLADDE